MTDTFRAVLYVCVPMLAATGCAGSSSTMRGGVLGDNSLISKRYPANDWIVAIGDSTSGRGDAESTAKARVAEQVQSSIQSEFQSVMRSSESTRADGKITGQESLNTSAAIVSKSSFDRAELIRVVPEMTVCKKHTCSAVAVLSRDEVAKAFGDTRRKAAGDFFAAVERALNVAPGTPASVNLFATPYNTAMARFDDMETLGMRSAAVRRPIPVTADERAALERLNHARESVMKGFVITLGVDGDAETRTLGDHFMKAFDKLGVSVVSASRCSGGFLFVPKMTVECERAFIGTVCTPRVTAELRECGSGQVMTTLGFDGLEATGASTQNAQNARAEALSKLNPAIIAPELKTQLSNFLPLR